MDPITASIQVKLILAFIVGAIIGLERQFAKEVITEKGGEGPGVRSFGLVSLLGASVVILENVYQVLFMVIFGFLAVLVFTYVYLMYRIKYMEDLNLTTSIAFILAFILGIFVGVGEFDWALIISVFITAVLSIKHKVMEILRSLEYGEITSALQIAIIALVFIPIIPPIKIMDVLELRMFFVFLLFVLIVEFIGYVAMRHLGEQKGILALAWFGAFVHSESTTMEIVRIYKKVGKLFPFNAFQVSFELILLSLIVRSIIFLTFLLLGQYLLLIVFIVVLSPSILFGVLYVFLRIRRYMHLKMPKEKILSSPLSYSSAIKFALVLFLSSFFVVLVRSLTYNIGAISYELTLIATFLSGFFSVSGIELAVASLYIAKQVTLAEALELLVVGLIAGILNKPFYTKLAGGAKEVVLNVVILVATQIALILFAHFLITTYLTTLIGW